MDRGKEEKMQKRRREKGRGEGEHESLKNIVCDGCIRIDSHICHIRSINIVFVQEGHLDKCLNYEARNHLMAS